MKRPRPTRATAPTPRRRSTRAMLAGALCCALLTRSTALATPSLARPDDPVVLTGSNVAALLGAAPGDVVAFRWIDAWEQVPVQVDERAVVDLNKPFNNYSCAGSPYCFGMPPSGTLVLQYTDATTYTGADPDPTLDADDEIVLMAKDAGDRPAPFAEPTGVVPGSGVEVHVTDPLDGGEAWLYLFRQTGGLDPSAGRTYVSYDFELLSGSYAGAYLLNGGPNPENSAITSAFYSRHFSDRWLDDQLTVTAGGATGVDVLDRDKVLLEPGNCIRSEDTLDAGEGCFVANKSGPVRAIRSYMGANSGPHTQRQHLFYERREDVQTFVRVHALPGVVFFLDYSPAADGMVYRNDANPSGVTIDGVPDVVNAGPSTWETVDGVQGGLTMLTVVDTDISALPNTSYYLDDVTPGVAQCTGDGFAYGSSGLWVNGSFPSTDVAAGATNRLSMTRVIYFEAPGETDGPGRRLRLDNPLAVTASAVGGGGGSGAALTGAKLALGASGDPARTKLAVLSRDPAVGLADDPTQQGGTLRVAGIGFDDTYPLPAAGWTALRGGTGWRYRDDKLVAGPIKLVIVKPGKLLKATGKGAGLGHSLAQDPRPVDVVLTVGTQQSCLRFGGTTSFTIDRRFKAKTAPAPASCP